MRTSFLWGERSSPGLLQRPWMYFIAGAALIAVGAFVFVTAHPADPVKIASNVADYQLAHAASSSGRSHTCLMFSAKARALSWLKL